MYVANSLLYPLSLPPLTGAIPADEKHKCKPEDQVSRYLIQITCTQIYVYMSPLPVLKTEHPVSLVPRMGEEHSLLSND